MPASYRNVTWMPAVISASPIPPPTSILTFYATSNAWDADCYNRCFWHLLVTWLCCANVAERINVLLWDIRNIVWDGVPDSPHLCQIPLATGCTPHYITVLHCMSLLTSYISSTSVTEARKNPRCSHDFTNLHTYRQKDTKYPTATFHYPVPLPDSQETG